MEETSYKVNALSMPTRTPTKARTTPLDDTDALSRPVKMDIDATDADSAAKKYPCYDSFSTTSANLILNDALDLLLQPHTLLAEVLTYAGPDGIAKLRNFPAVRERIAELPSSALTSTIRAGFPEGYDFLKAQCSSSDLLFLRGCLTESVAVDHRERQGRQGQGNSGGKAGGGDARMLKPRQQHLGRHERLNHLGMVALAQFPLASNFALRNLCHLPSAQFDDKDRRIILESVAMNPASSADVLNLLLQNLHMSALCKSKNHNGDGINKYFRVLQAVARHRNASPEVFAHLFRIAPNKLIQLEIAQSPNASAELLASFIHTEKPPYWEESTSLLAAIATNANTRSEDLDLLSQHEMCTVRGAVAANPNTSSATLRALTTAADEGFDVRLCAAGNPRLPGESLATLSLDENWTVRAKVAANSNADADTLARLSRDEVDAVRWEVAKNPGVAAGVVFAYDIRDPTNWPILAAHSQNPAVLSSLANIGTEEVQVGVAGNIHASDETLCMLGASESYAVRERVAGNPSTPAVALTTLSKDARPHIRAFVARNPSAIAAILDTLSIDEDEQVRQYVACNANTLDTSLETMAAAAMEESEGISRLALDDVRLLTAVADHPNTPAHVLVAMLRSEKFDMRREVARNPRLPACHLAHLSRNAADALVIRGLGRNVVLQKAADQISCSIFSSPNT